MPKKPKLDVNDKRVKEMVLKTGGRASDIDRASTATGKRAERAAAKLQGDSTDLPRSSTNKMKGTGHGAKRRNAA